jgi:hypothetical protein
MACRFKLLCCVPLVLHTCYTSRALCRNSTFGIVCWPFHEVGDVHFDTVIVIWVRFRVLMIPQVFGRDGCQVRVVLFGHFEQSHNIAP